MKRILYIVGAVFLLVAVFLVINQTVIQASADQNISYSTIKQDAGKNELSVMISTHDVDNKAEFTKLAHQLHAKYDGKGFDAVWVWVVDRGRSKNYDGQIGNVRMAWTEKGRKDVGMWPEDGETHIAWFGF